MFYARSLQVLYIYEALFVTLFLRKEWYNTTCVQYMHMQLSGSSRRD